MKKTSRRSFIKISALGFGAIALAGSTYTISKVFASESPKLGLSNFEFKKVSTYCDICFWKCAGWTYVDPEGKIKKVVGNEKDTHCLGRLCPRGTAGSGMYNDDDRLKTPMIRVEKDGIQTFREATWDEAFDLIAEKMKMIKSKYGPESLALLKHGSPGKHFAHLLQAYGSSTVAEPAYAQCRGPRGVGFKLTFGQAVGSPECTDIRDTKCLVLIGSHIGENMHNTQVQEVSEAIDKGVTIITVDPRLSTIANKSKYWLPIRPSTDIALLLAWMHVLIYEELYNFKYVYQYCEGFAELKEHVRELTPEWAYSITDIKPDIIRKTAKEMSNAAPAVIVHPGRHVTWYGDDTQRSRAIAILNALLGSWGNRGGFYFKEKAKVPKFPCPDYPATKWTAKDLNKKYPLAKSGITSEVINASLPNTDSDHKVKAWIIAGTNLMQSVPEKAKILKAIEELEFLVVVDLLPVEITGYADVILPECSYLERYDQLRSSTWRTPSIALRMPAADPRFNSKPAWWMAKQIGERLGLGEYFKYNDFSDVLDWQLKEMGSSLEEMQKIGVKNFERKGRDLFLKDGEKMKFKTPSGKIELYSKKLKKLGFDPMPVYISHEKPPKGYYRLSYGRAPMHTFTKTINNPHLNDLMDANSLWINPRIAKKWNLVSGDEVWLKNQDGLISDFSIKVRVTERMRWDSVYMVHGFGHNNKKLTRAFGKGISDNDMITKIHRDPLMGGTGLRGNFVTILTELPVLS